MDAEHTNPTPDEPRELTNPLIDDWDAVDEAIWESFPASDPPSHWAGRDRGIEEPNATMTRQSRAGR